jgi:signal transduction histidine kinase
MSRTPVVQDIRDLGAVLEAAGEATDRLRHSHDRLLSEVARLSTELEQKNRLLARKTRLEVLGEMAAGVAHEIRNPLGGILLYAGLLERELAGTPTALKSVRSILRGVHSLDSIVGDLLSFTRGFEPAARPCRLDEVCEEALRDAIAEFARTDIRVRREYVRPEIVLEADPDMLRRAVLNLVLNAIQAMRQKGDLTVRTTFACVEGAAAARIEVADTGPGIAPEVCDRLFEPYVTSKSGGTGLGLAIVQKIVESHGGEATGANRDEGGAVFTITLPIEPKRRPSA